MLRLLFVDAIARHPLPFHTGLSRRICFSALMTQHIPQTMAGDVLVREMLSAPGGGGGVCGVCAVRPPAVCTGQLCQLSIISQLLFLVEESSV